MQLEQHTATWHPLDVWIRFVSVMDVLRTCCADPGHHTAVWTQQMFKMHAPCFCVPLLCWWHMLALHGHLVYLVARWIKLRFRKVWQWVTSWSSCRIYEIRPGAGFLDGFEQVENVGRDLSLGPGGCMRFPMDFPQHLCSPCIYIYTCMSLYVKSPSSLHEMHQSSIMFHHYSAEPNFESRKAKNIPIMWHLQVSVLWNLKIFHKRLRAHLLFFFHDIPWLFPVPLLRSHRSGISPFASSLAFPRHTTSSLVRSYCELSALDGAFDSARFLLRFRSPLRTVDAFLCCGPRNQ